MKNFDGSAGIGEKTGGSVAAAGGGRKRPMEDMRSSVVNTLISEGGEYERNDGMPEYIQKQFPMTEMSSLQIEIFKGMAE
jgi:hypothetical protein